MNIRFSAISKSITLLLTSVFLLTSLANTQPVIAQNSIETDLSERSPNYFYNRESAFILQYGLDLENGGMYLAVDKDGSKIDRVIPGEVWAYKENTLKGTDKTQVGQATCIRYFINEYLRTKENGIEGINALLPDGSKLSSPEELLKKGDICADFAIEKQEIGSRQNETFIPNALFYWGVVSDDGSITYDDSAPENTTATYRSESSLSWSIAEYALAIKRAGLPQSDYQPYLDAALRWWNWRKESAIELNEDYATNITPGAGRDLYYPALGFILSEITGNPEYRDGDGSLNADGSLYGAIPFANSQLGTGSAPDMPFGENKYALQEKTYTAALARGTIFAKHSIQNPNDLEDRDQWWDFGWYPHIEKNGSEFNLKPATSYTDTELSQAFKHTGGRELLAGVLKSIWFYSTHGANPEAFYIKDNANPSLLSTSNFNTATKEYWDVLNEKLWDDTPGQAAWLEAIDAPYKPCFSGDNDIPFGDWKKPVIGDKVHSLNGDNSATVTVSGVFDPETPYMSTVFNGSGVNKVEVVYSLNQGQTWTTLPANFNGTNYTSTIPAVEPGITVYYYAKAVDNFNNWTVFPVGSETWNDRNETVEQDYTQAQFYTTPNPEFGFGGGGPTSPIDPPIRRIEANDSDTVPPFGFGGMGPSNNSSRPADPSIALIRTGGKD